MTKTYPRKTLSDSIKLTGPGLHSGTPVTVHIHPGTTGFVIKTPSEVTPATPESVSDTTRCTQIGGVSTVEHALSALHGLGLTDAIIEVVGGELPAAGGSTAAYCEAIQSVGTTECGSLEVEGPFARVFHVVDGTQTKYAVGLGEGFWRTTFELPDSTVGSQEVELSWSPERYVAEIAPARTFVLQEELEAVKALGLGKGLDESSCFVLGKAGYVTEVKFSDEPVRHKMLDMIGDLALTGIPIAHLDVIGSWTGHRHNVDLAKKLVEKVTITRHDS